MSSTPTQTRHPWRAVLRTLVAVGVPMVVALPQIVAASGFDQQAGWVTAMLGASAAITRVLAVPQVNDLLMKYFPALAATPRPKPEPTAE